MQRRLNQNLRKRKQQQLQHQQITNSVQHSNLSLVWLCVLIGVLCTFFQLYVHSGITSNVSYNNLDDDNTLYVGGDDDKLLMDALMNNYDVDKQNGNHNIGKLRQRGPANIPKQQSKDTSSQTKSKTNQSENNIVNQNTKISQQTISNENTKETPNKAEKVNEFRGEIIDCGCPTTCTPTVLLTGNAHFSCKTRITKLMAKYNFTQHQACEMSSKSSKDDEVEDKDELKPCPMQCHPKTCHSMPKYGMDCGCPHTCDERALHKRNAQFLCKDRISHLMNKKHLPELEACALASQTTYNFNDTQNIDINTPCEYECHPEICKDMKAKPVHDVTNIDLPKEMPFTKYDGVVIVTKVLSTEGLNILIQMLCLFNAAYNRFVNYDIIVFTTIPFPPEDVRKVQEMAHPAKLQVVTEGKSLEEHLNEMTPEERQALNKRCRAKPNETLTWSHHCEEDHSEHVSSLGYAWQAEFRSYHIWTHEAMKPYKYMMWLDADAMCTKTWDVDPMKMMIENDLVLLFDHFPGGYVRGEMLKKKMMSSYNEVVCGVSLDEDKGILIKEKCEKEDQLPSIHQVYGFHHITNLDVYRKERHQRFLKELITNEYKFSRLWDDQLAVTFPAVMEDPSRCWDYQSHGLNVSIHHNGRVDGKKHPKFLSYLNYWANDGKYLWPAGRAMCDGLVTEIC